MAIERRTPHKFTRGPITVYWDDPIGGPFSSLVVERRVGPRVWRRTVGPVDYLDVPEAALAMMGADRTSVYRLVREGSLRAMQRDGGIWIQRAEVDRYLAAVANQGRGRRLGQRWRKP